MNTHTLNEGPTSAQLSIEELGGLIQYWDEQLNSRDLIENAKIIFSEGFKLGLNSITEALQGLGMYFPPTEPEQVQLKTGHADLASSITVPLSVIVHIPEDGFSDIANLMITQMPESLRNQMLPPTKGDLLKIQEQLDLSLQRYDEIINSLKESKEDANSIKKNPIIQSAIYDVIKTVGTWTLAVGILIHSGVPINEAIQSYVKKVFVDLKQEELPKPQFKFNVEDIDATGGERT
ncbi:hypothetical protein POF51_25790 [Brevibacillus sp. AG]|uniref:hypothetical protein n=1 Tax=Brevibacillus sp. AG TaxID=3020891 RepID=UPI00232C6F52|nr:hypothetical protein [Brevibacillus sp. AG]MDC0764135.1 hypothetical protein [Brevibacillus sp. AG]